jgi:hypothetical protein
MREPDRHHRKSHPLFPTAAHHLLSPAVLRTFPRVVGCPHYRRVGYLTARCESTSPSAMMVVASPQVLGGDDVPLPKIVQPQSYSRNRQPREDSLLHMACAGELPLTRGQNGQYTR